MWNKRSCMVMLCIFLSLNAMEMQEPADNGGEMVALGGAHDATQAFSFIPLYDSINELRLLMIAVVNGIVVRDHAILLPGRAQTIPLVVAGEWINRAMNLSFEQTDKGEAIIDSQDTILRECQKAQKRLWEFVCCFDLLESGTDNAEYKEMLHINRILRVTSLITQNEEILKEVGRAPVQLESFSPAHRTDMHSEFLLSQVSLMPASPTQGKKGKGCLPFLSRRAYKK